jgi:hypothetical protein
VELIETPNLTLFQSLSFGFSFGYLDETISDQSTKSVFPYLGAHPRPFQEILQCHLALSPRSRHPSVLGSHTDQLASTMLKLSESYVQRRG